MPFRIVVALSLFAACGDNIATATDAAPDGVPGQGSPATAGLVINEIAPRGDGPDWIELVNRSGEPVDLCDYFLSDSLDRLDHYLPLGGAAPPDPCEPDLVPPGVYLIVEPPFGLGIADEVHLIGLDGAPVDSLVYLYRDSGQRALGRHPDRDGLFYLGEPTPGERNR